MKLFALTGVSCTILLLATLACAGTKEGGGGSDLESTFRLDATKLIEMVADNPMANKLCPASVMKRGLDHAKVDFPNTLVNTVTGKAISHKLDAWTKPGLFQLRFQPWSSSYLQGDNYRSVDVAALILHEVYRSTGACNDDTGSLSTAVIQLLTSTHTLNQYDRVYAFKYFVPAPANWSTRSLKFLGMACESPENLAHPTLGVACILAGVDNGFKDGVWDVPFTIVQLVTVTAQGRTAAFLRIKTGVDGSAGYNLFNLMSFASPAQPLYGVFHLKTGDLSYGYDLNNLTTLRPQWN